MLFKGDFDDSAWFNSHCKSDGHKDNVAILEAEENDDNAKKMGQKSMTNFFTIRAKSTKQINKEASQAARSSAEAAATQKSSTEAAAARKPSTVITIDEDQPG